MAGHFSKVSFFVVPGFYFKYPDILFFLAWPPPSPPPSPDTKVISHTCNLTVIWHVLQRGFLIMNETYKFNVSGVLQEHANVLFLHTGWIRRPHRFSLFRDMFEAVNGSSVFSWTSRTPLVLWCSIRLRFCVLFPFPCLWCPPLNTAAVRTQYKTDLWGDYL